MARKSSRRGEQDAEGGAAFVVGAIIGGIAGAAWTLFNTPRSGAETRAAIVRAVESAGRALTGSVDRAREQVRETGERAADRVALTLDSLTGGGDGAVELLAVEPQPPAAAPATASSPAPAGASPPAGAASLGQAEGETAPSAVAADVVPAVTTEPATSDDTEPEGSVPATATT